MLLSAAVVQKDIRAFVTVGFGILAVERRAVEKWMTKKQVAC